MSTYFLNLAGNLADKSFSNSFGSVVDKTIANAVLASYFATFQAYVLPDLMPSHPRESFERYP